MLARSVMGELRPQLRPRCGSRWPVPESRLGESSTGSFAGEVNRGAQGVPRDARWSLQTAMDEGAPAQYDE